MELADDERRLILAALYVLNITHVGDNDEERDAVKALARKLGGDPDATHFRST